MADAQRGNNDRSRKVRFVRKVAAIGLSAALGGTLLVGCGGNGDQGSGSASDSASSSSLDISFSSSVDQDAQQAFRDSAQALLDRNAKLESAIAKVQELVDSNPNGVGKKKLDKARAAIKAAKKAERQVPDVALSTAAVKGQATAMDNVTYATQMEKLLACMDLLQPGAQNEWAQANNEQASGAASTTINSEQPASSSAGASAASRSGGASSSSSSSSGAAAKKADTVLTAKQVSKAIKGVKHVSSTKAATKKNDPNGLLGTKDGYQAAVFFTSDLVDHDAVYGQGILAEGTDGGGCVEVYATKAKAQKRNKYLGTFDDTKISSGSHKVAGTCVVRTSSQLSTPQQKKLTKDLTKALEKA